MDLVVIEYRKSCIEGNWLHHLLNNKNVVEANFVSPESGISLIRLSNRIPGHNEIKSTIDIQLAYDEEVN